MLRAMWEGWMSTAAPSKDDYAKLIALSNEGAQGLGFKDVGALWRSGYDMDPDAFAAETDRLWAQVAPLYKNLHCYVRRKLNEKYGDAVQPNRGPIRADLLGNMWGQDWSNIYDVAAPKSVKSSYSIDQLLKAKRFDAVKMVKQGEAFYTSIGLDPLPATFWERSLIVRPKDREVVCHASAWDLDNADDIRIKMCTEVNAEDFYTVHHELGHNYYQRAYKNQPFLFKNGANDGFHEAIGDFIGLSSVTPTYLQQIKLLNTKPAESEDLGFLMSLALQKVAFLPFGLMVDRWRWDVYSGKTTEANYNQHWWELINKYQGLTPPTARPTNAFDAGAKYHVPASVPYTRYFLAHVLQFQFQKAACDQIGWDGPLNRCSIYGHTEVGAKFNKMMQSGQSMPWPDALEAFTGTRQMDGAAVMEYFAPLNAYLSKENEGQSCGW
jgi:peptidyl-dipeptidase A